MEQATGRVSSSAGTQKTPSKRGLKLDSLHSTQFYCPPSSGTIKSLCIASGRRSGLLLSSSLPLLMSSSFNGRKTQICICMQLHTEYVLWCFNDLQHSKLTFFLNLIWLKTDGKKLRVTERDKKSVINVFEQTKQVYSESKKIIMNWNTHITLRFNLTQKKRVQNSSFCNVKSTFPYKPAQQLYDH